MEDIIPLKHCSTCGNDFPLTSDYFYADNRNKSGFRSPCKTCIDKYNKSHVHYQKDKRHLCYKRKHPNAKQKIKEVLPDGYRRCCKCTIVYPATPDFFYKRSREKDGLSFRCKQCIKKYRETRRDAERVLSKKSYRAHREEHCRKTGLYQKSHREQAAAARRRHYQANKGKILQKRRTEYHLRRARKRLASGNITPQQIQQKLKLQHYACYYCFKKFLKRGEKYIFHIEHTIPLSRTEANPANDINYVVLACAICNHKKGKKLPHEFPEGGRLF